jgi:uncharacterized protein (UPF0548 family)
VFIEPDALAGGPHPGLGGSIDEVPAVLDGSIADSRSATTVVVFLLARPNDAHLHTILSRSRDFSPTYEPVGATQTGEWPVGYRRDEYTTGLGSGKDVWDRAVLGLRQWVAHTGAGAEVVPADAALNVGETVLVLLRAGPFHVVAPCRIVYVIDEARQFGFGYGTLPGHPEEGEESFVLRAASDGQVRFAVTAFSHPAETITKLGSPVARVIQRRVTTGYLDAMRHFVSAR